MTDFTLNIRGRLVSFDKPAVMGIINATPDSFYASSRAQTLDAVRDITRRHMAADADMLDIGACSTRPGSKQVTPQEEIDRLAMAMQAVRAEAPDAIVSVDTYRAKVARVAVEELGCDIVNDISGGSLDHDMLTTVASLHCPYVLMHMRGTPEDMNKFTDYDDVVAEVLRELSEKVNQCSLLGINDIIIDPGFGFAKTLEQNYRLMANLEVFEVFNRPILVGISRKSMLTKLLDINSSDALNATTALNAYALDRGASILRVHDVAEAVQTVKIHQSITQHVRLQHKRYF